MRRCFTWLMFLLACLCVLPAMAQEQVQSAPLSRAVSTRNGMVRVYLSSLGSPTTLDVTVAGKYTADGAQDLSLTTGETVRIRFDTSTGQISLVSSGKTYAMGQEMALRRHATSGSNGVRIAQARKSGNLYPGDLRLIARKSGSSWRLYPIAYVYMEDYLCGVVPYEMGNGAQLEALKAQAVAARTYTLNKMNQRSSGLYDVVDTTNDQVYYGNSDSTTNCMAAVLATKGIVLMNGSTLTNTWYTASNGGQTESAKNCWGSGGYDYLTVKDDPFDLGNSLSTVKSATIYGDYAAAAQNAQLRTVLESKVRMLVGSATIRRIAGVTPHTPKFGAPSRLYTKMDFQLQVISATGNEMDVTVTCDIFDELESILGLRINAAKNELWSVEKVGNNFAVKARRYGHGVGMSQRGAMRMGALGYTYDQILGFYYENSRRVQYTFTQTILSGVGNDTIETEEPPAELPEETAAQASVQLPGANDVTAMRTAQDAAATVITYLSSGTMVTPLAKGAEWTLVRFGSLVGYVRTGALRMMGEVSETSTEQVTAVSRWATVSCTGTLNLRKSASMTAKVLTTIPNGEVLVVLGTSGGFAHVQYGAYVGYASTDFLRMSDRYPDGKQEASPTAYTSASVNLRASASTGAAVLAVLPKGTQVLVIARDGTWCAVVANNISGYVMTEYLTGNEPAEPTPTPSAGTTPDPDGVEAIVTTAEETALVYDGAGEDASVISALSRGESVLVTSRGEIWCVVRLPGLAGYMRTADLRFPGNQGNDAPVQGYAQVTTPSGSLNLRTNPRSGSEILTTIPRLTRLPVLATEGEWVQVRYEGITGWVMRSFLIMENRDQATATPAPGTGSAYAQVMTPSGSLNLRQTPSSRSKVLITIPRLTRIAVLAREDGWTKTNHNGYTGWVMDSFLNFESAATERPATPGDLPTASPTGAATPEPIPTGTAKPTLASVRTGGGALNLRESASSRASVLARIPEYAQVQVLMWGKEWCGIRYEALSGWVMTRYLSMLDGSAQAQTAWVTTPSGSLNLRGLPSTGGKVLATIYPGTMVQVLYRAADWCQIVHEGMMGYVMTAYLRFSENAPTPSPTPMATAETETPTAAIPTQTPAQVEQETTAWVTTPSGSLNFRADASTKAAILRTIAPGTRVTVVQQMADGWTQIRLDSTVGFVQAKFLTNVPPQTDDDSGDTGDVRYVITPSGSLNLREEAKSSAAILATIPRGESVRVLQAGEDWCRVRYQGTTGYVMTRYLTGRTAQMTDTQAPQSRAPEKTETESPTPMPTPVMDITLHDAGHWQGAVAGDVGETAMRAWCDRSAPKLRKLTTSDTLRMVQLGDEWCLVSCGDQQGYVETSALALWQEGEP